MRTIVKESLPNGIDTHARREREGQRRREGGSETNILILSMCVCMCARACCVCWCVAGGDLSHINIDIPRQNVCVSVCLSISLCQILQSASCWIGIITISFQPSCLPHLSWGDKASVQMNLQADIFMDADAAIPSCSRAQARTPARASECTRTRTYSRTLARTHTRTRTDMHTPRDTHMRARAHVGC